MTIKELENRTGMTRANIRFYEGEGLLSPKRLDNGYRDYSEEDARTLEKIKLLRRLQLDIETIRRVQQGELTLEQALFAQATKLEGDKAVAERAAQVCRGLEQSGVEYAALEPQPWLRQLEPPRGEGLPPPPPAQAPQDREDGVPRACRHPWRRLFARALDMALYGTLIDVAYLALTRSQSLIRFQADMLGGWAWDLGILLLTLAAEPLWLHFWGWTPGKWIFGLKLRNEDGDKLTLAQGWERSWQVFREGYGWDIPFYGLWRFWKCRETGLEGRDCPWDGENGYQYTREERRIHGGWVFAGAQVLCAGLLLLALLWSAVPPCRGNLTVADFARNYNHSVGVQRAAGGDTYEATLDGEGHWRQRETPDTVFLDEDRYDQPEFTVADGHVTAVRLHMYTDSIVVSGGFRETMAVMALIGSADGVNLFSVHGVLQEACGLLCQWENLEADFHGLHISQQVEYTGYTASYSRLWIEDIKTPHHCEKTVTISFIEST